MSDKHNHPSANTGVDYEHKDLKPGWLAGAAVGILLVMVSAMLLLTVLVGGLQSQRQAQEATPLPFVGVRPTPPLPRLQPNPIDGTVAEEQLSKLHQQEEKILTTYGWVDKNAGKVRVPITTAIELLTPDTGEPPK